MAHAGMDTKSYFDAGMTLSDEADVGMAFDRVYGSQHEARRAETAFKGGGGFQLKKGYSVANMLDPLRTADAKKNLDLSPPPRAKFLHTRAPLSLAMQGHMAEVVTSTLNPNLSQCELARSQSKGDFAWGSDRIAHELAHKLDQFTRRPEDGVRKLLWTVGTDHGYESKSRNSISVTPKNLTGLCNRFGLACNDGQAQQIFERHRLPRDGCNVHTLSTHLLNPHVDTAQLARAEGRRALGNPYASSTRFSFAQGPRTPRMSKDPFKMAKLPGTVSGGLSQSTSAALLARSASAASLDSRPPAGVGGTPTMRTSGGWGAQSMRTFGPL